MTRFLASKSVEDTYAVPPADWLAVFSLGHREAAASALYPLALIYFGQGITHHHRTRYVFEYAETIAELDPEFREIYRFLSTAALYRLAPATPEELRRTVAFVRRGADRFPDDGGLAWNAAATMAYEVAPLLPKEEREALENAAQPYFARAIETGHAPYWLALTTADRLGKLGMTERAAQQILTILPTIDDEATRLLMIQRLEELRAEADYEGLVQTLETLSARHQAEFPYVPFDFYLVLGPAEISAPVPDALLDLLEREPRP